MDNKKNVKNIESYFKLKITEAKIDNKTNILPKHVKNYLSCKFKAIIEYSMIYDYISLEEYRDFIMRLDSFINN